MDQKYVSSVRTNKRPRPDPSLPDDSLSIAVRASPAVGVLFDAPASIRDTLLAHCATTVSKLFKPVPSLISKQLAESRSLNKLQELKSQGKLPKSMSKAPLVSLPSVPGDEGKSRIEEIDKRANADKLNVLINTRTARLKDIVRQIAEARTLSLAALKVEIDSAGSALAVIMPNLKDGVEVKVPAPAFVMPGLAAAMDINPDIRSVYSQPFVSAVLSH